ncbi:MAG: hypothetical protein J6C87_03240 [Bacteroides sp.]|nr:hypothetical protein [Bacteroides sp.]
MKTCFDFLSKKALSTSLKLLFGLFFFSFSSHSPLCSSKEKEKYSRKGFLKECRNKIKTSFEKEEEKLVGNANSFK